MGFVGRLDTYIGNWGGVRLLEGGRPSVPPLRRRRGKSGRRVQEAAPYKRGGGGKPPALRFSRNSP